MSAAAVTAVPITYVAHGPQPVRREIRVPECVALELVPFPRRAESHREIVYSQDRSPSGLCVTSQQCLGARAKPGLVEDFVLPQLLLANRLKDRRQVKRGVGG